MDVVAAQAPRRVHYAGSSAYTWFYIHEAGHPEHVTFGDALFQLEQLVYEISESGQGQREELYLLGYDQGALLALALSLVVPDYLAGVVAICGCMPDISVWPLPERSLDGLAALLVYDPNDADLPTELVRLAGDELTKRGGTPTLCAVSGARKLDPTVFEVVGDWMRTRID
jgi:predicted esterase